MIVSMETAHMAKYLAFVSGPDGAILPVRDYLTPSRKKNL